MEDRLFDFLPNWVKAGVRAIVGSPAEVRNSERLLRLLLDHSSNGIIRLRWDHDEEPGADELRCIYANHAAGLFLNADPEKMIGLTITKLMQLASSAMDQHESEDLSEQFLRAAKNGEVIDTEIRVEVGSAEKWLRVIAEPIGNDVAVTFVDITDHKEKENAVNQELLGLRERVRELEDALEKDR